MKSTLKLFYAPVEQQYYIYYFREYKFIIYRVENINPLNIMPVDYIGIPHTSDRTLTKEVEEFAKEEFAKLNFGY
jgi:hypothetical protein